MGESSSQIPASMITLSISSVSKSCLTLCHPMDLTRQAPLSFSISQNLLKFMSIESVMLSKPGSSVHGISQARKLEGDAISFSRGSSRLGIKPTSPAWQADSLPLSHLGSPQRILHLKYIIITYLSQ